MRLGLSDAPCGEVTVEQAARVRAWLAHRDGSAAAAPAP
jgi:hypothetical protein